MSQTISSFLSEHLSDKKAIGALNKKWLSYGALRELKKDVHKALRKNGIAKQDRVAIVLPNGPTMATAFVTIAQCTTCLLYTSPSPRDRQKSRMPSSA